MPAVAAAVSVPAVSAAASVPAVTAAAPVSAVSAAAPVFAVSPSRFPPPRFQRRPEPAPSLPSLPFLLKVTPHPLPHLYLFPVWMRTGRRQLWSAQGIKP